MAPLTSRAESAVAPVPGADGGRPGRRSAAFKQIPPTRAIREQIRRQAGELARSLDRSRPLSRSFLEQAGRRLLSAGGHPEGYLGFAMVAICNEFWRDQFMATAFRRRLLLLPRCLKHDETCRDSSNGSPLDCGECTCCFIAEFKGAAEKLGYRVHVADGTPTVMKIIVNDSVDAVLGIACLNVLEKAIDKVLKVGVPSLAVPLLSCDCKQTSVDRDWVREVLSLRCEPSAARTRSYLPLLRAAHRLFDAGCLERLAPRLRTGPAAVSSGRDGNGRGPDRHHPLQDPLAATEQISYQWLMRGGKRLRPFITLASYDALIGAPATRLDPERQEPELPDALCRVALAIETFHKASLVHDDIEDDDSYRYGEPTLHRKYGVPVALNVGDYLIGLGYRLLSRDRGRIGGDCAADILHRMAEAHQKLAEGQGAELLWRASDRKSLTPVEALRIYALKTAPAFEAALYSGLRLAGPADQYERLIMTFCRHLGTAFQIINDLKDWEGDQNNKLLAGQDVLAARPTVLLALALEGVRPGQRAELLGLLQNPHDGPQRLRTVRRLFEQSGAFASAEGLVQKYRQRATAIAEEAEPTELRDLLLFLIATVLDRDCPDLSPDP